MGTTAPGQLKLTRLFGKSTGPTLADSAVAAEGDVTRLASANSAVVADRDAVEPSSESLTSTTEDREDNAECLSKLSRRGHGTEQSSVRGRESSDARCGESPLRGRSFQHTLAVKQDSPPHSSREEPPRLVWPKSGPEELRGEVTPKSSMKSLPLRERLLLRRSLTPPPVDVATSTEASACSPMKPPKDVVAECQVRLGLTPQTGIKTTLSRESFLLGFGGRAEYQGRDHNKLGGLDFKWRLLFHRGKARTRNPAIEESGGTENVRSASGGDAVNRLAPASASALEVASIPELDALQGADMDLDLDLDIQTALESVIDQALG